MSKDGISELRTAINAADNVVFFTGAGISTESGIPDFRSQGSGIWEKMTPIVFEQFLQSEKARTEQWGRLFSGVREYGSATPNAGHKAVATLIANGKSSVIITQNVDNLHQAAGVSDDKVIELHGNASYASCLTCHVRYELDLLDRVFKKLGKINPCKECGGIIKSATISFGQPMPEEAMARAQLATNECNLMIVAGSSLTVYPAAGFPEYAKQKGAKLIILNREPTPLDGLADLVLHCEIGPTLTQALDSTIR